MRLVFLVPELVDGTASMLRRALRNRRAGRCIENRYMFMRTATVWGGTLNILRHANVARRCGADVVIATRKGKNCYSDLPFPDFEYIRWSRRKASDICIIPDVYSNQADRHGGRSIVYQQNPIQIKNNFDFTRAAAEIWTDSPYMLQLCQQAYPGKEIPIVPNVVDNVLFPYIPQNVRAPGELIAFPRKGSRFIDQTLDEYHKLGGRYWKLHKIAGLSISQLATRFSTPQCFLASAEIEGCALPPQEAMASGIVVVGKDARGANFSMQHQQTALVANDPIDTAHALFALEDELLRNRMAKKAYEFVSRFFPQNEPARFWEQFMTACETPAVATEAFYGLSPDQIQ